MVSEMKSANFIATVPDLSREIAAYERMKDALETDRFGKWVVIQGEDLIGAFDSFSEAAGEASRRFAPCLIRQVGAVQNPPPDMRRERDRAKLSIEIAAYERMRDVLETDCFGKWVVFHDEKLIGAFDSNGEAVSEAYRRFGRGPYLIRRVGASPYGTLPSWTMTQVRRDADR